MAQIKKLCGARAAYWLEKPHLFVALRRRPHKKNVLWLAGKPAGATCYLAQQIVIAEKN
ncbi:MAG: hypothetical protein ACLPID_01545 [Beijerinckiaceae bacterium]